MTILNLNGIEVNFPFEPYECQQNYMKAVIDCLIQKKNGILESPTGTGKTLCLLCSSISWLLAAKADMQYNVYKQELASNDVDVKMDLKFVNKSGVSSVDQNGLRAAYPKIIYASRTHSQLTQVVRELKMSHYK
jgi:regulator of telomere elongation helicase 1